MKNRIILALLTALITFNCIAEEISINEINSLRENMVNAFNSRDYDKMLQYLSKDVIITWQDGTTTHGIDELKDYYNRMMVGPNSVVLNITGNPEVEGRKITNDTVVSFGKMNDHFELRDGMKFKMDSRFSALITREKDRLVVAGMHLSVNAFENEIIKSIVKKTILLAGLAGLLIGATIVFLIKKRAKT